MPKKPSPNLIKKHRIYLPWEAANALGMHKQSVIRWIKDKGLVADQSQKPWLIKGSDLKLFLGERKASGRYKLSAHHLYCFSCRLPQMPDGRIADYKQQTETSGMLIALCPVCGCLMHKTIKRSSLEAIRAKIEVTIQQASPRLVLPDEPTSTVTLNYGAETHVKTQAK
ncbi:MAG: helix-turn-helix domain-containing protein [Hyphomicrobiales bacterium]|nr:helix-turn-helix domain-containing protein [Hyphomicrobiales bacterium]